MSETQKPQNGYVAGFKGEKIEVYAESLWAAKQAALAAFKPSKKNVGLVWVMLAELATEPGKPVVHVAVN